MIVMINLQNLSHYFFLRCQSVISLDICLRKLDVVNHIKTSDEVENFTVNNVILISNPGRPFLEPCANNLLQNTDDEQFVGVGSAAL